MADYSAPAALSPDGLTYCAPWCGGGCTKADFDAATAKAERLAARMGEGWEPVVHENLGWHFRVRKGIATIYDYGENSRDPSSRYSAWLEPTNSETSRTIKQFIQSGETPEDALGFATEEARSFVSHLNAELASILS